jgi:hypothetical protein
MARVKNVAYSELKKLAAIAERFEAQNKGCLRTPWGAFLRHGRTMKPESLSFAEARVIVEAVDRAIGGLAAIRPKQCYWISQAIVLRDFTDRIEYIEGYLCNTKVPIPIDHAWIRINGKMVDLTLRALNSRYSREGRDDYLGIVIPKQLLRRNALKTGVYGSVVEGPFGREVFPK